MKLKTIITFSFVFALFVSEPLLADGETAPQELTAEQLQADFRQLYEGLKSSHINLFVNTSEDVYQAEFERVFQTLSQPMTRLDAQIIFQQFVALGKIGHARIDFPDAAYDDYRDQGGVALPIYITVEDGRWLVAKNYSEQHLPIGAELTHIDQRPVANWFQEIARHISADSDAIALSLLEFQLPQYLWLIAQPEGVPPEHHLRVVHEGEVFELRIKNLTRDQLIARSKQYAEPDAVPTKLRDYQVIGAETGYLRPGPFYNAENPNQLWDNTTFKAFIDDAFQAFIANDVEQLIIDVRNNPGGTNSFSDHLIAWFADRPFRFASKFVVRSSQYAEQSNAERLQSGDSTSPSAKLAAAFKANEHGTLFEFPLENALPRKGQQYQGKVFVLVDRSSYSNAVSLAAIVQDYDFGTVIGESTVDFATTYASMETFALKQSGIKVGFPKAHIIRPSGDTEAGPLLVDELLPGHPLESIIKAVD